MVMGELFLHLKRNMEYELEKTVIALILKSGDTNKFLREDCHVALDHMVLLKYISLLDIEFYTIDYMDNVSTSDDTQCIS